MRRLLLRLAVLAALFALVLWVTFPTDVLVRWALAHAPLPAGRTVEFRTASLRPWGLRLDDVVVREQDGRRVLRLAFLRLRPSWLGLFGPRPGFPWTIGAGICSGEVDATVDDDGTTRTLDAGWSGIDVGLCLPYLTNQVALSGRSGGSARLRVAGGDALPVGDVAFTLADAAWEPPRLEDVLIHADAADVALTLGAERLTIERATLRGPELEAEASGGARRARTLGDARLDVHLVIHAMPGLPDGLRRLLDGLPRRADGAWDFRLAGTLDVPRVERP